MGEDAPAPNGDNLPAPGTSGEDGAAPSVDADTPQTAPVTGRSKAASEVGSRPETDPSTDVSIPAGIRDDKSRTHARIRPDAEHKPGDGRAAAAEDGPGSPASTRARPVVARGDGEICSAALARDAATITESEKAPSAAAPRPAVNHATVAPSTVAPVTGRAATPAGHRVADVPGRPAPSWARPEGDNQRARAPGVPKTSDTPTADVALPAAPPAAAQRLVEPVIAGSPQAADSAEAPLDQPIDTPTPAEISRHTAARRLKMWTPILLLLAGAVAGAQLLRPLPDPHVIAANRTHTVEGRLAVPWPDEGQGAVRIAGSGTISTFGVQKSVPIASVAKIMTAYVVLKDHPLRKGEPPPSPSTPEPSRRAGPRTSPAPPGSPRAAPTASLTC